MTARGRKKVPSSTHPNHEITALIRVNPEEAKRRILAALRETGMHKALAAKKIGCAHSTLIAWIAQLEMAKAIDTLVAKAQKEGWHHDRKGGRPTGTTVANGAAPRGSRVNPG